MCLLAFYYDRPQEMRPEWVVNVDNKTREPITGPDGKPLLDDKNPAHEVKWETLEQLVAEGRIIRANTREPVTDTADLLDPENDRIILIEKLAMRKVVPNAKMRGEMLVRKRSPEKMLPHFISQHLPWGAAGLILAALLAASMSSIDSGLNSICTLVVMDLHRRYGWGKAWLARRLGKQPDQLNEVDELRLAQPLTLIIGLAATAFSIAVSALVADIFMIMVGVANTFGAPLLAVFLLGMLTRRTTAAAALAATVMGGLFTVGMTIFTKLAAADYLVPRAWRFHEIWIVVFGTLFTFAVGYALSFVIGRRKTKTELRGLVAGCGTLGVRASDEEMTIVSLPPEAGEPRWKK